MPSSRSAKILRLVALTLLIPLTTACGGDAADDEAAPDSAAEQASAPPEQAELDQLRQKFEPLRDFAQAAGAGYDEAITPCWFHREQGGQGVHYGRTELFDSVVTTMDPELVMYEPQQGGGNELIGVEYIVPFANWTSSAPPTVLGHPMHRNEPLGLWVHHVWLFRENPSGMYADWNPNVSCANAAQSEDRATVTP
jgi:hypothetical protein